MPNEVTYFVQITDPDSAYNVGTLSLKESFNFRNLFKGTLRTNNLDIEIAKIGPSLSNLAEWSGYQVVRDGEMTQFIKLMSSSSLMFRSVSITGRADKVTDNVDNDVSRRQGWEYIKAFATQTEDLRLQDLNEWDVSDLFNFTFTIPGLGENLLQNLVELSINRCGVSYLNFLYPLLRSKSCKIRHLDVSSNNIELAVFEDFLRLQPEFGDHFGFSMNLNPFQLEDTYKLRY